MSLPRITLLIWVFLFVSACARHSVMRGGVAMKVSENEAHVCLNKDEVKVGDRVVAFYNDCQSKNIGDSRGAGTPCIKTQLGRGTVTKILSDHYSLVKFDEGVQFSESTFVEK